MRCIAILLGLLWQLSAHANDTPAEIFSGSGYAAADGTVVNYTYNNFGGFYLTVSNHRLRWEGFHGYFHGLVSTNAPQISEVAPDVFLYSWRTRGSGSDNVVHNYNTMRVTAHLQPDQGRGEAVQMIHGVIHCRNTPACIAPSTTLTPPAEFGPRMGRTIKEFGLPPMFDPAVNNTPRALADIQARELLRGQAFVYDTPEGQYRIEVADDTTTVSLDGQSTDYQTYASRITDGVYFISWMGGVGGSHVVINTATAKVYDHILPGGERRESVFELACFGRRADC